MSRDNLLRRLEDNLQKARAWREQAASDFEAAIQAVLTPGRNERLTSASREYSRALEAVNIALKEYNDFMVSGLEPASVTPVMWEKVR